MDMEFCEKCDNFVTVRKKRKNGKIVSKTIYCPSCGHEKPFVAEKSNGNFIIPQKIDHDGKDKTAILSRKISAITVSEEDREALECFFEGDE